MPVVGGRRPFFKSVFPRLDLSQSAVNYSPVPSARLSVPAEGRPALTATWSSNPRRGFTLCVAGARRLPRRHGVVRPERIYESEACA